MISTKQSTKRVLPTLMAILIVLSAFALFASANSVPAVDGYTKVQDSFSHPDISTVTENGVSFYRLDLTAHPIVMLKQNNAFLLIWTKDALGTEDRQTLFADLKKQDGSIKNWDFDTIHFYSGTFRYEPTESNVGIYEVRSENGQWYMLAQVGKLSHLLLGNRTPPTTTTTTEATTTTTQPTTTTTQPMTTTAGITKTGRIFL